MQTIKCNICQKLIMILGGIALFVYSVGAAYCEGGEGGYEGISRLPNSLKVTHSSIYSISGDSINVLFDRYGLPSRIALVHSDEPLATSPD